MIRTHFAKLKLCVMNWKNWRRSE